MMRLSKKHQSPHDYFPSFGFVDRGRWRSAGETIEDPLGSPKIELGWSVDFAFLVIKIWR